MGKTPNLSKVDLVHRRLLIVSSSTRIDESQPESAPALNRYNGTFIILIRKYVRQGYVDSKDVLIVSPSLGMIRACDPLTSVPGQREDWNNPRLEANDVERLNRKALQFMRKISRSEHVSEVYVNVGKLLMPIINGFEELFDCRIEHAQGKGIGPKSAHMKSWILKETPIRPTLN